MMLKVDNIDEIVAEVKGSQQAMPVADSTIWFDAKHDTLVARELVDAHQTTEPLKYDEGAFWQYQGAIWQEFPKSRLEQTLDGWQEQSKMWVRAQGEDESPKPYKLTVGQQQKIVGHAPVKCYDTGFFDRAPAGIMLRTSFIRALNSAITVEPASASHGARVWLDVRHDPNWELPADSLLSKYLQTTFDEPGVRQRVSEVAGAALMGLGTRFKKAWFFVDGPDIEGSGGTGKSQMLELLRGLVPDGAWCSVVPQDFSDDYKGAELRGKTLNVVFETPETDIIREDGVKAIVHGDTITRRRIRQDPITFTPRALHVFATNRLPEAPGATGAFWDRWEVVEFNRRFRNTDKVIPHIAERILAEEMHHLVHWAINGARQLLAQGRYTRSFAADDALRRWRISAEPVAQFVDQWLEIVDDSSEWTAASEIYAVYSDWCEENGRGAASSTKFGRRLRGVRGVQKTRSNGSKYNLKVLERHQRRDPWTG